MGIIRRYWEIIKLFFKFMRFRIRQSHLKTSKKTIVKTTYGPIQGVQRFSIWNDPFYSFEKIPFAKPPLGELRFKAPQPPDPWTEVKDCTAEGPMPLQTNLISKYTEGSEDCLYLNVYTKNLNPNKPMPVMVWIYGGGFETGGATKDLYSPDYFMQKDVVIITITYRVGPFGFLSLNDPDLNVPGNAGLKDQVLALKWIKLNCLKFGGNPNNITLFGESAGAASTHYMMLTEQTKGLFHRAILMSGCVLCPWASTIQRNWAYRLAKKLGYNECNNDRNVLNFLCATKGTKIVSAIRSILSNEERQNRIFYAFGPCIEPYLTENCVIPEEPRLMMRKAWGNTIPIIIGATSFEGLFCYPETQNHKHILEEINDCEYLVPMELNLDRYSQRCRELGLRLRKTYFGDKTPGKDTIFEYLDLLSYKYAWHGIHRTIQSRLKYSSSPTYLYRFDFDSPYFNHIRILYCGRNVRGVCHADDLSYIFYNLLSDDLDKSSQEYKTVQRMICMWTEFASFNNPNHEIIKPENWLSIDKNLNVYKCLNISNDVELIDLPEWKNLYVWDSLYEKDALI